MRSAGKVQVIPKDIFYGWWIVAAGTLATMLSSTFSYYGFSTFFPAIEKEFGWSRAAISGAFSLSRIESGVLGPLEGYLTERFGSRRMMMAGVVLLSIGFVLFSQVNSMLAFYLVIIFGIVLGGSLGFHMPVSFAVANWFHLKRGKAFGILRSGPGLAGLLVPLVGFLIVALGWRLAAVVGGLTILVIGLPLALVMRTRPEECGLCPDGVPPSAGTTSLNPLHQTALPATSARHEISFTSSQALRTTAFWLLSIAMTATSMATSGVLVHFVVMLEGRGIDVAVGTILLGLVAFMSIPGRLGFTWLSDYLDGRSLLTGLMVVLGATILCMAQVEGLLPFVVLTGVFAITYGGSISVIEPLRADYFGVHHFASIMGFMRLIQAVGHFAGPLLAGVMYDVTQSYVAALTIFGVCVLIGAACMFMARRPSVKMHSR